MIQQSKVGSILQSPQKVWKVRVAHQANNNAGCSENSNNVIYMVGNLAEVAKDSNFDTVYSL